jgi:hypothetical protein
MLNPLKAHDSPRTVISFVLLALSMCVLLAACTSEKTIMEKIIMDGSAIDYAKTENMDAWLRHPVLGDP